MWVESHRNKRRWSDSSHLSVSPGACENPPAGPRAPLSLFAGAWLQRNWLASPDSRGSKRRNPIWQGLNHDVVCRETQYRSWSPRSAASVQYYSGLTLPGPSWPRCLRGCELQIWSSLRPKLVPKISLGHSFEGRNLVATHFDTMPLAWQACQQVPAIAADAFKRSGSSCMEDICIVPKCHYPSVRKILFDQIPWPMYLTRPIEPSMKRIASQTMNEYNIDNCGWLRVMENFYAIAVIIINIVHVREILWLGQISISHQRRGPS